MHKYHHPTTGLLGPVFFSFLLALGVAMLMPTPASAQARLLPTQELQVGDHVVTAEIASDDASRAYGLMNRQSLPDNYGMLFVFDSDTLTCFWMRNTPLALSIAFIDAQGRIANIADMQPHSLDQHCPVKPIRYALEMKQGWFRTHGVQAGARIRPLP